MGLLGGEEERVECKITATLYFRSSIFTKSCLQFIKKKKGKKKKKKKEPASNSRLQFKEIHSLGCSSAPALLL